jgi:queuine tRNA-ribosyltransferase
LTTHHNSFDFEINATQGDARAGTFITPHGKIETPIFAPVGTQATVKAVTPAQLLELGANLILANTYHLYLRPGEKIVEELGGLHAFMDWKNPILTDSGGFQVYSLSDNRKVDQDGVKFKSHVDGSMHYLTPEKAITIQESLGADIIMALDECAPPYDKDYVIKAMNRTHEWAQRCKETKTRTDQALFGIVQGGIYPELRKQSAEFIAALDLPGNAIGGLSVGETKEEMFKSVEIVNQILPFNRPRYLMGVGTPKDFLDGVARGVDIFDCVLPTRLARHNAAMTLTDRLNIVNAQYKNDPRPIEDGCSCYTCGHFSRAYLRHLIIAKEILASTLLSIHNLHVLLELSRKVRQTIIEGNFTEHTTTTLNKLL